MSHLPDAKALTSLIQKALPRSRLLHTWPLSGGISATMMALEVQLVGGQTKKLIVRSHAHVGLVEKEFRLLQLLQTHAIKTPTPYLFDQSDATASLVIDYIKKQKSARCLLQKVHQDRQTESLCCTGTSGQGTVCGRMGG